LINSGFYDIRKTIRNLGSGQKFVLLFKLNPKSKLKNFNVNVGEKKYLVGDNCYLSDFSGNANYLTFVTNSKSSKEYYISELEKYKNQNYRFVVSQVSDDYNLSEIEFLAKKI
jgi:hypothetical protein